MTKRMVLNFGSSAIMAAGLAVGLSAPLSAHHSFAGYDMEKSLAAPATLKEFRWGAPHSMVVFMIKGEDGKLQEVTMGSASPSALARQGFKPRDFKVGDKMDITWRPSKSGAVGGLLSTMKLADGRTFNDPEFGPTGSAANRREDRQATEAQLPPGATGAN